MNAKIRNDLDWLETLLGSECFFKAAEHYAGRQLYFPKKIVIEKKHETIRREYRQGTRFGELADKYGYSTRYVRTIIKAPQKIPAGRLSRLVGRVLAVFRGQRGRPEKPLDSGLRLGLWYKYHN
jgi:hypothetical protein